MKCVGVVAALEREIRAFGIGSPREGALQRLTDELIVTVSGLGAERAYRAGKRLLDAGAAALASWGSAAALDVRLAPGNLLLPSTVISCAGEVIAVDAQWREQLLARLRDRVPVHTGALIETSRVLTCMAEKQALAECSGAVAADMESAAIARLAREAGIAFIAVRAIADSADAAVPARLARAVSDDGQVHLARTLGWLAFAPGHWGAAFRLGRQFRAATLTLSQVARDFPAYAPPDYAQGPGRQYAFRV